MTQSIKINHFIDTFISTHNIYILRYFNSSEIFGFAHIGLSDIFFLVKLSQFFKIVRLKERYRACIAHSLTDKCLISKFITRKILIAIIV